MRRFNVRAGSGTTRFQRGGSRRAIGLVAVVVAAGVVACGDDANPFGPNPEDVEFAAALGVDLSQMVRLPSGTYIQDLAVGIGDTVVSGDSISVHYEGWLADGTKFDSSLDRGTPFVFTVGVTPVIPGWQEGIPGMIEGGLRKLVIPAAQAYRASGQGPIPGNAVLVFDVELLDVVRDTTSSP